MGDPGLEVGCDQPAPKKVPPIFLSVNAREVRKLTRYRRTNQRNLYTPG
jgi:hypothetical protein